MVNITDAMKVHRLMNELSSAAQQRGEKQREELQVNHP